MLILIFVSFFQISQQFSKQLAHDLYVYTKATVCEIPQIEKWNCGYFCDQHPDLQKIKVFESVSQQVLAFAGINTAEKRIIVSFRSTQNLRNFLNDLKFLKSDYNLCNDCKVHTGFLQSYEGIKTPMLPYVQKLYDKHNDYKLTVVGHSLGAALATLAAIDLSNNQLYVDTFYIFGSPRIGNLAFAQYFNKIVLTSNKARVTHFSDIVPHLPPKSLDYIHAVKEYWFNSDFKTYKECKKSEEYFEDDECSNQIWSHSISDHRSYFNIRYKCNDDNYIQKTQNEIIL